MVSVRSVLHFVVAGWLVAVAAPVQSTSQVSEIPQSIPATSDEFVGPFSSWASVKGSGAAGNGVADDTAAIQRGLDALGTTGQSPVLFLPNGIYRITRTLT